MKIAFCFALSLVVSVAAPAAVLFNEPFDYPNGAITNVAAGVWVEHSSGVPLQVVSGQAQVSSAASEDVHAALTNQPFATGVTLYASFTVTCTALPTAGGAGFAHFNSSSFRAMVWASTANAAAGKFRLGIANTASGTAASGQIATDLSPNVTYAVVIRYVVGTASSTIWLNPSSESDASVTATDTATLVSVSNFSLRQLSGEGTLLLDDLRVGTSFAEVITDATSQPPAISSQPQDILATAGDTVMFSVAVSGTAPFDYQWSSNNIPVPGATNATFTLENVTTNLSGSTYFAAITNASGATNSDAATLTVIPPSSLVTNQLFTYLTYNVNGNGVADWSTNSAQVQAVGRQLLYLQPDIIAFNEIPHTNVWQMANWVVAYLPGYALATNSATDGYINNVIASRWPIVRSKSWLSSSSLTNFGYNGRFTRDLFEAEIVVPGYPQHLHVFDAHLKATDSSNPQANADERAAQCRAITNFLATNILTGASSLHPYILSGDLNESALYPETNKYTSGHPIQILVSDPTGLRYTDPVNPITHTDLTESIRGPLDTRFDYIFPCTVMFSNIVSSQVFRTDLLTDFPPNLFSNDDKVASDHLPVLMTFANPYAQPFTITAFSRANQAVNLQWQSVPGGLYRAEISSNLSDWTALATNVLTTNYSATLGTNASPAVQFFRLRTE